MYHFGVTTIKPSRKMAAKLRQIAKAEESEFTECNVHQGDAPGINNGNYQAWFTARNYGEPFDSARSQRVYAAVANC